MKTKNKKAVLLFLVALLFSLFSFAAIKTTVADASTALEIEYILPLSKYPTDGDKVYNSNGEEVPLIDGAFIATEIDTYRIEKNGKIVKLVKVLASVPDASFQPLEEFPTACIAGQTIELPAMDVYFLGERLNTYTVSVYADGELLKSFTDVSEPVSYTFAKATDYEIRYSAVAMYRESSRSFTVTAENASVIIYEKPIPSELSNKNEYALGNIYGYFQESRYPATVSVTMPSGDTQAVKGSFTPRALGEYKITAETVINGTALTETTSVLVVNTNASLFSEGVGLASVAMDVETPVGGKVKGEGVEVSLSGKGAYAYYNQVIDLTALGDGESVLSFYAQRNASSKFTKLRATLIDANDSSNYFSVYWFQSPWNNNWSYCLVEYDGYALGLNNEKDGKPRPIHGAALSGMSFAMSAGIMPFNFSYSVEEKAVYTDLGSTTLKILDLDDEKMLGEKATFKGFSSNEVYLKVELDEDASGSLLVLEAGGQSFHQSVPTKQDSYLRFAYDGGYNPQTLLTGAVGYEYTLPMPVADDLVNGTLSVSTRLYFRDGSGDREITDKVQNGKFLAEQTGEYTVVYECVDPYGNTIEKSYEFSVSAQPTALEISNGDLFYDLGALIDVPQIETVGGTGTVKVEVEYAYNGNAVEPDINGRLHLDKKGEIAVKVRATDFLGVTAEKMFVILVNDNICILEVEEQPIALFAGREYTLADFTAFDYSFEEGQAGYEMSKTILVDGEAIDASRVYTFTKTGKSVITYIGGLGTSREIRKEVSVTILPQTDNNAFDITEYITASAGVDELLFQNGLAFASASDFEIFLPSAIPVNNFQIAFACIDGLTNYSSVRFVLEDYQNPRQQLSFEVKNMATASWSVVVNDKYEYALSKTEGKYGSDEAKFYQYKDKKYYTSSLCLYPYQKMLTTSTGGAISEIGSYLCGDLFTGFESGLVRVKINVCGVSSHSAFVLETVGNQNMTRVAFRRGDKQGAMIGTVGQPVSEAVRNQTVILPRAIAYDVLQGKAVSLTGYVQAPTGKTAINPAVDSEYTITDYGVYTVVYEAKDYYGNIGTYEYTIYCRDTSAPEIVLPEGLQTVYAVGDSVVFPAVQASDNVGVTKTYILVKTPENRTVITDGSYAFEMKGRYEVVFYARDAAGNSTQRRIVLEVE